MRLSWPKAQIQYKINTINRIKSFTGASPGLGRGGRARIFFQIWEFACRKARGVRGHAPREIFLKRCNLVRFRVYFDQILSLFFSSKITIFIYKINILDTRRGAKQGGGLGGSQPPLNFGWGG